MAVYELRLDDRHGSATALRSLSLDNPAILETPRRQKSLLNDSSILHYPRIFRFAFAAGLAVARRSEPDYSERRSTPGVPNAS